MDIEMPQLGETVEEGTIVVWYKDVGDTVEAGEDLFEVSTEKVDSDVPSPVDGVLTAILVPAGETVPVATVLAVVTRENEPVADPAPKGSDPQPAIGQEESSPTTTAADENDAGVGQRLSPAVKRLIAENDLDPAVIVGSGVGGRISRDDVLSAAAAADSPSRPPASEPAGSELKPFSAIRRATAAHMVASKAISPHALSIVEVDYANVDRIRKPASATQRAIDGTSITYLPFIARAVVDALASFPRLNAWIEGDSLRVYDAVNLGVAVDLDGDGLVVPVIRDAQHLLLRSLREAIGDVAGRARDRKISVDELSGGTFTISNNGSFGTLITAPIINQPQVAVLSTDAISLRPVVVEASEEPAIAIHPVGHLAMSWDHRAIDGGYAGPFLVEVRRILETRDWSTEI